MIGYELNRQRIDVPTTTRKPATAKAMPGVFPVPVPVQNIYIKDRSIQNDGVEVIDVGVENPMEESPRHLIDSNQRLYNEISVPYKKPRFSFPKIRLGRDVN